MYQHILLKSTLFFKTSIVSEPVTVFAVLYTKMNLVICTLRIAIALTFVCMGLSCWCHCIDMVDSLYTTIVSFTIAASNWCSSLHKTSYFGSFLNDIFFSACFFAVGDYCLCVSHVNTCYVFMFLLVYNICINDGMRRYLGKMVHFVLNKYVKVHSKQLQSQGTLVVISMVPKRKHK